MRLAHLCSLFVLVFIVAGCSGDPIPIGGGNDSVTAAHCHDGVKDADETDVDCGGPACGTCGLGKSCGANGDCATSVCQMGACVQNGGCGMCNLENAVSQCLNNACTIVSCKAGFADCNKSPTDGCEVNLLADVQNCGACGTVCDFGAISCAAGTCVIPQGNCNGGCNLSNATSQCVMNSCVIDKCNAGYGDCNLLPKDGCETNLYSDALDCGACGHVCPMGESCVMGACQNPNACNKLCAMLPNATSQCINNSCVITSCHAGFGDCDKDPNNGCEVNLTNDHFNCGACGAVCPMGESCLSGACK